MLNARLPGPPAGPTDSALTASDAGPDTGAGRNAAAPPPTGRRTNTGRGRRRRAAVVGALVRPSARGVPWAPLVGCLAAGLATVGIPVAASTTLTATDTLVLVRLAAVMGAAGFAFVLTDPAHELVAPLPTPRLLRHAVRVLAVLPVLACWWGGVLAVATARVPVAARLVVPPGPLTLELGALLAVAAAAGAVGVRLMPDGNAGVLAAPSVLALVAAARVMPWPATVFANPGDQHWRQGHLIWAVVLSGASALFVCLSMQPVRRTRHTWRTRRTI